MTPAMPSANVTASYVTSSKMAASVMAATKTDPDPERSVEGRAVAVGTSIAVGVAAAIVAGTAPTASAVSDRDQAVACARLSRAARRCGNDRLRRNGRRQCSGCFPGRTIRRRDRHCPDRTGSVARHGEVGIGGGPRRIGGAAAQQNRSGQRDDDDRLADVRHGAFHSFLVGRWAAGPNIYGSALEHCTSPPGAGTQPVSASVIHPDRRSIAHDCSPAAGAARGGWASGWLAKRPTANRCPSDFAFLATTIAESAR